MRSAIVSDIHANFDALHAVLTDAGDVDAVWCLGDIIDNGPEPNECIDALRQRGAVCIFGNHEEWVAGNIPPRLRNTAQQAWANWTYECLSRENRAFLAALPEQTTVGDFTLLHYPHAGFEPPLVEDLVRFSSPYCLIGHTHFPLVGRYTTNPVSVQTSRPFAGDTVILDAERAVVNVGSVGSSFVDARLACYLRVDQAAEGEPPTITFRAVPYPVQSFVDKLHSCGVPPELASRRQRWLEGDYPPVRDRILATHRQWYP